jgi:hypothetical protein
MPVAERFPVKSGRETAGTRPPFKNFAENHFVMGIYSRELPAWRIIANTVLFMIIYSRQK